MKKRATRTVWGLSAILAVLLLGAGVVFVARYQTGLSPQERLPHLLPRNQWGFSRGGLVADGPDFVVINDSVRLGFFELPLRRTVSHR
jgi:hypothetical protein